MLRHRRRPRRLVAAAAAATAALLALSGCNAGGGDGASNTGNGTDTGKAKAINVAVLVAPGFNDCVADAAASFKKSNGTTVNLVKLPYASLFDKYESSFQAGSSAYDLLNIAFQWTGQFADQGGITSATTTESTVIPALNKQYQYNGKQYAVPYLSSVYGYFYRTDILKKYDMTFPTSIDQLQADVEKLSKESALKSAGVKAISVMGDKTQGTANFDGLYKAYGGPDLQNAKGQPNALDTVAAAKALTTLKEFVSASPAGALTATFATTPAQFANGKVVFEPQFSTAPGNSFDAAGSKIAGKYAFAAAPGGGDLGGWGFAVSKASSNQKTAAKFANYLASPAVDLRCAVKYGKSPVVQANFQNADVLKSTPFLPDVTKALASGVSRFTGPKASALNDTTDSITSQFISGQIPTAAAAASQLATRLKSAG